MGNSKFKIVSKVLSSKLEIFMHFIISKEKKGFIQRRKLKVCIYLAFEVAILLHNKTFGGNIVMKIDISKAFKYLSWHFIIKELRKFSFDDNGRKSFPR